MKFSGGALTKGKIAGGCVVLLGGTTFTGLVCTEIYKNGVSSALAKLGGWVVEIFNWNGTSSSQSSSQPIDPIPAITEAWSVVSGASTTVLGAAAKGYQWIEKKDNAQFLATFFKNFGEFSFVKSVVFNLHLTIRAWLGVLFDSNVLSKVPDALKIFAALAVALSQDDHQKNGEQKMINWLYLRFFINPRKMITILKRGAKRAKQEDEIKLECNGAGKGGKKGKELLGSCFICKDKKKLKQEVADFLKEGKMPEAKKKE